MRVLAHLSDLHFGKVAMETVAPLVEAVHAARPDVTVVSGDFVQWGRRREFEEARDFVQQLPEPRILVPGNHDLPFGKIWRRFTVGLRWYREFITEDLKPHFEDDELAVLGVNTARTLPLRGGRISEWQVREVERRLCAAGNGRWKVLVTHHPFDLAGTYHHSELVGRARMAMGRFARSIDLLLAGHMHISHAGRTAVRYRLKGRSAIFVQAGTATSARGRGEPNAFNLIRLDGTTIQVDRQQWNAEEHGFRCACTDRFENAREPAWCPLPESATEDKVEAVYSE